MSKIIHNDRQFLYSTKSHDQSHYIASIDVDDRRAYWIGASFVLQDGLNRFNLSCSSIENMEEYQIELDGLDRLIKGLQDYREAFTTITDVVRAREQLQELEGNEE